MEQKQSKLSVEEIIRDIFGTKTKSKYFHVVTFAVMIVAIVAVYFVGMEVGRIAYTVLN